MNSTEDVELRCVKCEDPGVIRVTAMTFSGPSHVWYCPNPQCMYQRELEGGKT